MVEDGNYDRIESSMFARLRKSFSLRFLVFVIVLGFGYLFEFSENSNAAIGACTASVTPHDPEANVTVPLIFTINNTDSVEVKWIRVTRPFSGITFSGSELSPPWYTDWATESLTYRYYETSIPAGGSISPKITVDIGDIVGSSGNWMVQVSDDPVGADPYTCTGDLSFSITGGTDQTAPTISNLVISEISGSLAKFSWTTNENANSLVQYGIELGSYPFSESDSSSTTTHSITIGSLGADTTYYYQVCSTDPTGNQSCSSENSFTTGAAATTTTTTVTVPVTTTVTSTVTKTVKDTRAPVVSISAEFEEPFDQAPIVSGRASDVSGIAVVEYSIDGGENWLPVNFIESPGGSSTSFEFIPEVFDDGNYEVMVRATDGAGNQRLSKSYTMVIDRLPPLVGGNLVSLGPLVLVPDINGSIVTIAGLQQRITLSTTGGAISVDLLMNSSVSSLPKSIETGLWSGNISFSSPGLYQLKTKSVDGAENKTERMLNSVIVLEPGKILGTETSFVEEAEVRIYYQDPESKVWTLWDGKPFGQVNPQLTNEQGEYRYYLPAGSYYFEIKATGYKKLTSEIFTLSKSTPINADFALERSIGFKIGNFTFSIPDLFTGSAPVDVSLPSNLPSVSLGSLVGKEAPFFALPLITGGRLGVTDMRGKPGVLSFVNTWSPPAIEQISVLNSLAANNPYSVLAVAVQERVERVGIFARRGGYTLPVVVDADGELVDEYSVSSLPLHYFLDRKGVVKEVVTGVLSEEEMRERLSEIF